MNIQELTSRIREILSTPSYTIGESDVTVDPTLWVVVLAWPVQEADPVAIMGLDVTGSPRDLL